MTSPRSHPGRQPARPDIRKFLDAGGELPSPRGVPARLLALLQDPEADLAAVSRLVRSDPALTGFILRAANAARFAAPPLADVDRAVARLGLNMVRVYAIALSVLNESRRGRCRSFDYGLFWSRSLLDGILMEALAGRCDGFPREEAFALGLLGYVGRLAFATATPEKYAFAIAQSIAGGIELDDLERELFGFDQNELTAVLLVDWGIPPRLADIVYWQRDPEAGGFQPDSLPHRLAGALQLAGGLAAACLPAPGSAPVTGALHLRAAVLGMSYQDLLTLASQAAEPWRAWSTLLELAAPAWQPLPDDPIAA